MATKAHQGTGLGLNISKNIIEQMHGSIDFDTEVSEGSRFYFELPIVQELI